MANAGWSSLAAPATGSALAHASPADLYARRLLYALLADPALLQAFYVHLLLRLLTSIDRPEFWSLFRDVPADPAPLLAPVIARLSAPDQAYWHAAGDAAQFAERLGPLTSSFQLSLRRNGLGDQEPHSYSSR